MNAAPGSFSRHFLNAAMTEAEICVLPPGRAAVFSTPSPDREDDPNEDAAAFHDLGKACVLAVADGAGGLPAGERASNVALEALIQLVKGAPPDRLRPAILDGFEAANRAVIELGVGAATTLIVVAIQEGMLRAYHVGDSMAVVTGQRGRLKYVTMAHSPVGYAVESGLMDHGEAMHHEDRHLVSNLVGTSDMRIEIGSRIPLSTRDTVVLGSDGLFDNLHLEEIIELVRKGPLETAAAQVVARCQRRMLDPAEGAPSKLDDLSFIIYRPRG